MDDQARHAKTPADPLQPIIFGLLELIQNGNADRWLLRIMGACTVRQRTDAYMDHFVAGGGTDG